MADWVKEIQKQREAQKPQLTEQEKDRIKAELQKGFPCVEVDNEIAQQVYCWLLKEGASPHWGGMTVERTTIYVRF